MLNFMAVIKFNKCTFDEWKKEMEEDTEMDGLFMRDVMLAKAGEHTAILCAERAFCSAVEAFRDTVEKSRSLLALFISPSNLCNATSKGFRY